MNSFRYKTYAGLAKSDAWTKVLKPDLEKIKEELSLSEAEAETEFEALKRDIKRSQTNKIINRIINLIEKAQNKINYES